MGETTVADIARSTGYSRQAVQRLADALAAEGSVSYIVDYIVDETDRRKQRIELTPRGRDTFGKLEANFDMWAGRLLAGIPEADLITVTEALARITAVVRADRRSMQEES